MIPDDEQLDSIEESRGRVEEASQYRCQGMMGGNQCTYRVVQGEKYCKIHMSTLTLARRKQENRNYLLQQYKDKFEDKVGQSNITSLRDEVAILRMLIETRINQCKVDSDLILQSNAIADLIVKVNLTVTNLHKLEKSLGDLLDKQQAAELVDKIGQVITAHVKDPDQLAKISKDLLALLP